MGGRAGPAGWQSPTDSETRGPRLLPLVLEAEVGASGRQRFLNLPSVAAGSQAWLSSTMSTVPMTSVALRALGPAPHLPLSRGRRPAAAPDRDISQCPRGGALEVAKCGTLSVARARGQVPDAQPGPLLGQRQAQATAHPCERPHSSVPLVWSVVEGSVMWARTHVCARIWPAEPSCGPWVDAA